MVLCTLVRYLTELGICYFDSKLRQYFLIPVKLQITEYIVGWNEIPGMGLTAGKIMQEKKWK